MLQTVRVLIDCKDTKGLVYKVSQLFYQLDLNIDENQEYVDKENQRFFMRTQVTGTFDIETLTKSLTEVLPTLAKLKVVGLAKKKVVLLVTKEMHCLGDLLIRNCENELDAKIVAVISNHGDLKKLVGRFDLPFFEVATENLTRQEHEQKIISLLNVMNFDYLVLAKYMRILSHDFVGTYAEKIINIHHSFLPSFIGANPYKQAWERGVKIIGATAHFVTNDLDEGPIICQNVINTSHKDSWKAMQKSGRDVERTVLAKALELVLADRVFVYNNKTVVL